MNSIKGEGYEIRWNNAAYLVDDSIPSWIANKVGTLEDLATVMADPRWVLDPMFEDYGDFLHVAEWLYPNKTRYKGHYSLSGNFFNVSCSFGVRIEPHRTDLINLFQGLIDQQKKRPEYISAKQDIIDRETWSGDCSCGSTKIIGLVCAKCHRQYKYVKEASNVQSA